MFCAKSWRQLYEHKQQNFILRWIASRAFALNGKHQLAPNKCWHTSIFSTLQFARKIISPFAMYQWPWLLAKQYARSQDQHHKHYFLYIVQFSCWCSQASIWSIKVDCRSFSAVFSQQNLRCSICAGAMRRQRNVLLRQDEFVRALQLLDKSCEIHVRTTTKSNNVKKNKRQQHRTATVESTKAHRHTRPVRWIRLRWCWYTLLYLRVFYADSIHFFHAHSPITFTKDTAWFRATNESWRQTVRRAHTETHIHTKICVWLFSLPRSTQ